MVKRKTAKELMAERNPLTRTSVASVDIYSQPPTPVEEPEEKQELTTTTSEIKPVSVRSPKMSPNKSPRDRVRAYSTYLRQSQVKGIKLRAIEREINDKDIVQEAMDEYFEKHPYIG
jgi:hypothetical protein